MFKKLNLHGDDPSKHGMRQSFTSATPNSRIVPGTATSPTQGFHAVGDETHHHHHHHQQQIPYDSSRLSATHYYNRDSSSTMYSTCDTRESYVDPVATAPAAGYSRETYIEPNTANVRHTQVGSTMSFNDSRRPSMNFFNDESSDSLTEFRDSFRVPSPEVPRVHQAESPIKMQQAYVNVPEPSSATIEPTATWADSVAMKPSLSTGSARHPPPLPPLVIPPTPSRSTHLPHQQHHNQRQQASAPLSSSVSPQRTNPPQLTPCTPASSRTSPMTSSPLAVSPRTPSPNTLQPPQPQASVSSPTSPKSPKRESASPMSETERLVGDGIKFHEAGQLEKATECFRQAAARDSPIGMFLYGVSLRHGWGCRRNEHVAFQYLQKAAEHAVMDLNSLSSTVNTSASKGELIIAIYELGVSFRHGWGCRKNKETAVYFFKIAADLGDPDAQNDLGHCYYHGHGVKKDLYMAAKYYRMADKQGHGIMGNSWIHKPKYDHPPSK